MLSHCGCSSEEVFFHRYSKEERERFLRENDVVWDRLMTTPNIDYNTQALDDTLLDLEVRKGQGELAYGQQSRLRELIYNFSR